MSDITGEPGSQLPYQEFSPYYLAPIGLEFSISLIQVDWDWSAIPLLSLLSPL